ncbi:uncharacterized protein MONBRDRAFT_38613 [Monosiga brevicollis MX1]|uniref:Cytochrome P450 n=1 Tax=Monosiga brevicollis TaxID=81824 RepID=A9V944_MONBE|nr:uncharacterized protein MONBRDRAFT_38613 [Monosiga brevicollis MX1]EDQ86065.1 predicted protein [Monosiga brevicollis MX1]|eukprot:XP_001749259.1 hypothetical protein [Monosiga brevicollis MX1]
MWMAVALVVVAGVVLVPLLLLYPFLPDLRQWHRVRQVYNARFGAFVLWFAYEPNVVLTRPEDIKQLLTDNDLNYTRDNSSFALFNRFIGQSIINANGEEWRRQHRILYKAFSPDKLVGFRSTFANRGERLAHSLLELSQAEGSVKLGHWLGKMTLSVIIETAFGNTLRPDEQDLMAQEFIYMTNEFTNFAHQIPVLRHVLTDTQRLETGFERLYGLVDQAVARRRSGEQDDGQIKLIDLILEANGEEDDRSRLDDAAMRDNLLLLLAAGTETTATTLGWLLYELAVNPKVFRPARFAPGGEVEQNPFQYFPFGKGRRYCLGKYFAIAELQVVVSHLLRRLDMEYLGDRATMRVVYKPPVLHASDDLPMRFFARRTSRRGSKLVEAV